MIRARRSRFGGVEKLFALFLFEIAVILVLATVVYGFTLFPRMGNYVNISQPVFSDIRPTDIGIMSHPQGLVIRDGERVANVFQHATAGLWQRPKSRKRFAMGIMHG